MYQDNCICQTNYTTNYIFILDLTPFLNIAQRQLQDERRNICKFWDLVRLILEIWRYF